MADELNKVLAEKYPRPLARASPARASPISPMPTLVPVVLANAQRKQAPLPKGRLSRSPSDMAAGWWWPSELLAGRSRQEVIQLCRDACQADSDAAGAKRDIIALANPGYSLQFTGSDRAKAQAKRELDQLEKRLGDFRGWDELINHQLSEAFEAGAGSLEAYPFPSRGGVAGVEIVPAEEITILREGNARVYRQTLYGTDLDPRTYVYSPFGQHARDPHGTPVMVSALIELERKLTLVNGTDKIINMISDGPFLEIGVPPPTLDDLGLDSTADPEYGTRRAMWFTAYLEIATQARSRGAMVVPDGVNSRAVPLTSNVGGIADLHAMNNMRLWSGLMTLPFLRGKTEGTTQALAEVMYPILLSHAENLQIVARSVVEHVMNLHLRLAGIPASVELGFVAPPNPFKLDHARAELVTAQADAIYMEQLGPEYTQMVAARLDLDPQKVLAWREANKPAPPPMSIKEDVKPQQGGDPNQQP
ncbi:hypothetical protein [Deinococcus alpinitundrae]|uniref:hypothetical protein n=1 Tax=Deinococcus alpinitundrae TaxID=468913 RepID=UPI00137A5834|nr:hypothetical protein [Deinococcus alpinitundrae]